MPWSLRLSALVVSLILLAPARADEAGSAGQVAWITDLPTAFAKAKEEQKILLVAVNAKHVAGRKAEEPAAKGLREVIYPDARVVEKSRAFVCALLTSQGSAKDFGELRALGISGDLVSPQHIFVHPDGEAILHRVEYWPHGQGEAGVKALLGMMDKAQQKLTGEAPKAEASPAEAPVDAPPEAPAEGDARAKWIQDLLAQVVRGSPAEQKAALEALAKNDQEGDCVGPLVLLIEEQKKNIPLIVAIVRALGRDKLESAALPMAEMLKHRDESVRGNAAVTLEYIGSREKKVLSALKKAVGKEKDDSIANHMYRALGRCGVEDAKIRSLLLKEAQSAKSEFTSYGPGIGLAYFEGDKKAARGVEKVLKRIGVPGSRRGGGQNAVKRSLMSWTLASIGDPKSGPFVREELMAGLEHVKAFWVEGLLLFWDTVARVCEGERELLSGVEDGVRGAVSFVKRIDLARYGAEVRNLMDEYREGRESAGFTPKGDHLLNDERGR